MISIKAGNVNRVLMVDQLLLVEFIGIKYLLEFATNLFLVDS